MTRNEAREILMQILFEMDSSKSMNIESAKMLVEKKLSGNHILRGTNLLTEIIDNIEYIDSTIDLNSKSWKTKRMPKVDLAIMRLAIGEMKYADDIPKAVSINEAINLAKKYSTEQSSKFIHGVLGAITENND